MSKKITTSKKFHLNSFLAGTVAIIAIGGGITVASAYAFNGPENSNRGSGIETATYEEWTERVADNQRGNTDVLEKITADNFDQFKEMMALQRAGDSEGADAIRSELGLPTKAEMEAHREAVEGAIEAKDYNAWKEAIADSPRGKNMLEKIDSEEDFNKLVEAHEYKELGQESFGKAREIMEELGFEKPEKGQGQGMRDGQGGIGRKGGFGKQQ